MRLSTLKRLLSSAVFHVVTWAIALLFLVPFAWMISSSLKGPEEVFSSEFRLIPETILWENYTRAFESMPVLLYTRNTLIITLGCIIGYLLAGSLVAYSFARLRWPGRDVWFVILLATMMLPPQVGIIPLFAIFRELRWIDTFYPLIVPAFLSGWPFFIFLMRQFFLTIPHELTEAARVDGASHIRIYASIILPLAKPALATVAIFAFLLHWNDFFGPLIYLTSDSKFTLALGLTVFASQHPSEWSVLMAVSLIMLLPTIVVFFLCQRTFVEGIALTGTKG
jgi:ABC-type glycerol-3-phosphate transport system permease component